MKAHQISQSKRQIQMFLECRKPYLEDCRLVREALDRHLNPMQAEFRKDTGIWDWLSGGADGISRNLSEVAGERELQITVGGKSHPTDGSRHHFHQGKIGIGGLTCRVLEYLEEEVDVTHDWVVKHLPIGAMSNGMFDCHTGSSLGKGKGLDHHTIRETQDVLPCAGLRSPEL